jgi:hypothetical protein
MVLSTIESSLAVWQVNKKFSTWLPAVSNCMLATTPLDPLNTLQDLPSTFTLPFCQWAAYRGAIAIDIDD